jgi:ribonuclease E
MTATAQGEAVPQIAAQDDDEGETGGDEGEQIETNADGSPVSADAAGEAERRRRRRGRRGGRRNRRGREGEAPYAGADAPQDAIEPDVATAVADLNGADLNGATPGEAPAAHPYEPSEASREQTSFPSAAEPMAAHEAAHAPASGGHAAEMPAEPPRRRSTVREPAPMFTSGSMSDVQPSSLPEAPAPEPVARLPEPEAEPAPEAEAKPRRFGWWNKRG